MKKILLLDDNPDIVQIVEEVLSYENFEVKSIQALADFFAIAEEFRADLIILDYRLGDGNGGDLCLKIKARASLKDTPIIIFSAYTPQDMDFRQFGCDAFIAKPFDIEELVGTANALMRRREQQMLSAGKHNLR